MGIGRGSIYDTLGSRRGLLVRALRFSIGSCFDINAGRAKMAVPAIRSVASAGDSAAGWN